MEFGEEAKEENIKSTVYILFINLSVFGCVCVCVCVCVCACVGGETEGESLIERWCL